MDDARFGRVWREWAPPPCKRGHRQWMPGHGGCPDCLTMGRVWRCRECGEVVFDPDHEHWAPS